MRKKQAKSAKSAKFSKSFEHLKHCPPILLKQFPHQGTGRI
jgi:hypothetical protein